MKVDEFVGAWRDLTDCGEPWLWRPEDDPNKPWHVVGIEPDFGDVTTSDSTFRRALFARRIRGSVFLPERAYASVSPLLRVPAYADALGGWAAELRGWYTTKRSLVQLRLTRGEDRAELHVAHLHLEDGEAMAIWPDDRRALLSLIKMQVGKKPKDRVEITFPVARRPSTPSTSPNHEAASRLPPSASLLEELAAGIESPFVSDGECLRSGSVFALALAQVTHPPLDTEELLSLWYEQPEFPFYDRGANVDVRRAEDRWLLSFDIDDEYDEYESPGFQLGYVQCQDGAVLVWEWAYPNTSQLFGLLGFDANAEPLERVDQITLGDTG